MAAKLAALVTALLGISALPGCGAAKPIDGVKSSQWISQKLTISYGGDTLEHDMLCAPMVVKGQGDGSILSGGSSRGRPDLLAMAPFPNWVIFDVSEGHLLVKVACENELSDIPHLAVLDNKYQQAAASEMYVLDDLEEPTQVTKVWPVKFTEAQRAVYRSKPISSQSDAERARWRVLSNSDPLILMDYGAKVDVARSEKTAYLERAHPEISKLESVSWVYKRIPMADGVLMKGQNIPEMLKAKGVSSVIPFYHGGKSETAEKYFRYKHSGKK